MIGQDTIKAFGHFCLLMVDKHTVSYILYVTYIINSVPSLNDSQSLYVDFFVKVKSYIYYRS